MNSNEDAFERIWKEIISLDKERLSTHYKNAQAYTNVIIVAGYGASLTVFSLIKSDMSVSGRMLVGFFLITSLLIFVGWEVYKLILEARINIPVSEVYLEHWNNPKGILDWMKQNKEIHAKTIFVNAVLWPRVLFSCLMCAGIAYLFLFIEFLAAQMR